MKEIGEKFKINDVDVVVVESNNCHGCYFSVSNFCVKPTMDQDFSFFNCSSLWRGDNKNVVYRKVRFNYGK